MRYKACYVAVIQDGTIRYVTSVGSNGHTALDAYQSAIPFSAKAADNVVEVLTQDEQDAVVSEVPTFTGRRRRYW